MKKLLKRTSDFLLRKCPKLGLNIRVNHFINSSMNQVDYNGNIFKDDLEEQYSKYLTDAERKEKKYIRWLTKDVVKCYLLYKITPDEYFMHDLRHKDDNYKASILGFAMKDALCIEACGSHFKEWYNQLKDKWEFYQIAKPYFKRAVCRIHDESDFAAFESFCHSFNRFIVKPNGSCSGKGIHLIDLQKNEYGGIRELFDHYLEQEGDWIIEELIIQDEAMAQWHRDSVNTVRVPSIMTPDGPQIILPLFRTGKGGNLVDNCHNDGGLMAVPDAKTGIIITDGYDIYTHVVECHPDSGLKFKGWQIPRWDEMVQTVSEIHSKCLPHQKYIGFDMALTPNGWVVIEGNWGNMPHQVCVGYGIRKEFEKLMKS